MTYLQAIILGLAQGLSEFLPISSSGHLALLQYFFGVDAEQVLRLAQPLKKNDYGKYLEQIVKE